MPELLKFQIVATHQEPVNEPATQAHITKVMVAPPRILLLEEVLRSMRSGDVYFTKDASTGKEALVHRYACSGCEKDHIRSAPDAVRGNNLDYLPRF